MDARRRSAVLAGALGACAILAGLAAAVVLHRCRRAAREVEDELRRTAMGSAPAEERLVAGCRLLDLASDLAIGGPPTDEETRTWLLRTRNCSDDRLPPPPAPLVGWESAHRAALAELLRRTAEGPRPEWRDDDTLRHRWALFRALTAASAVRIAGEGNHDDADRLLSLAWDLDVASRAQALGVLRCVRVRDSSTWLARLDGMPTREDWARDRLSMAWERWRSVPRLLGDGETGETSLSERASAAFRLEPVRERVNAGWYATAMLREARALRSAAACGPLTRAIPPTWRCDEAIRAALPYYPASLLACREIAEWEEYEVSLRVTQGVLQLRAGLPVDPCGDVEVAPQDDGRMTLRWRHDRHPILGDVRLGTWEFTFTP